ncbi:MAG: DNA repair protein RecO [Nostocaceae cyanobacterium]|nr:DNA repair protein RecO [Nostocaceae cyanobacterium]
MSRTYKATGINLKSMVLGEADRLVTILTREQGLIQAVAPGARKHNSTLGGRSGMFVVNEMLIAKGRSLDKITQAQTVKSYSGLSQDLGKLAASQYLAEITLTFALSQQPQAELYELLNEHLSRLEQLPSHSPTSVLAHLAHGVFHLLALAGVVPQVQICCHSKRPLTPNFTEPNWRVGFSIPDGGTVSLTAGEGLQQQDSDRPLPITRPPSPTVKESLSSTYKIIKRDDKPQVSWRLNATELALFQQLCQPNLENFDATLDTHWLTVEQILRSYTQYHFGYQIRSAALIDSYFASYLASADLCHS